MLKWSLITTLRFVLFYIKDDQTIIFTFCRYTSYKNVNLSNLVHIPVFELLNSQVWTKSILNLKLKDFKKCFKVVSIDWRESSEACLFMKPIGMFKISLLFSCSLSLSFLGGLGDMFHWGVYNQYLSRQNAYEFGVQRSILWRPVVLYL